MRRTLQDQRHRATGSLGVVAYAPPLSPASLPADRQASESGNPSTSRDTLGGRSTSRIEGSSDRHRCDSSVFCVNKRVYACAIRAPFRGRCRRDNRRAAVKPAARRPIALRATSDSQRSFQDRLRRGLLGMLLPSFAVALLAVDEHAGLERRDRGDRQPGRRRTSVVANVREEFSDLLTIGEAEMPGRQGRAHVREAGRNGAGGVRRSPIGARPER